ncbi:MAG TPA: tetratricopeptide repeat protein [Pyrinomonadaceae bacterium]|jgi:tetratricopeptide (TPR) repeat protein
MSVSSGPSAPRHPFRFPLALILIFAPLLFAHAQGVGSSRGLPSSSGQHIIRGRIVTPSGKPLSTPIKVRLDSNIIGTRTVPTEDDGTFAFNSLPAGNYTIMVDAGQEYEPVMEQLTITGTSAFGGYAAAQNINVPITLRPKGSAKGPNPLLANVPKQAVDLYNKALELSSKGDHKKAVEQLNSAIALHPNFALALNELGTQYLTLNQSDKALDPLQQAVKLTPEEFVPRLNYGIALWNQKKYAEAEEQLRAALKKNDASPVAHYYLGLALVGQRKNDEAETELLAAVKDGKTNMAQAHRYLGGIYWSKKEFAKAADELELYLKQDPKAPDAEKVRGIIKDLRSQKQ